MATITGTFGNDTRTGSAAADTIKTLAGNDTVKAGSGSDTVYGGAGNDKLYGEAGADTLFGEAGNDVLNGGSGVSHLDGGAGNDALYYGPATGSVASFGAGFAASTLNGGGGADTLHLDNAATADGAPAHTFVYIQDDGLGYIDFGGTRDGSDYKPVGTFESIEKLVLTGKGGADFFADLYGGGPQVVTGTGAADTFYGGFGSEAFSGGAGNDTFYAGGGNDKLIGGAGNDSFIFDLEWGGSSAITGFEGAGKAGGDTLHFDHALLTNPKAQIVQSADHSHTTITLSDHDTVTVDAVGLKEGVDWFFV